MSTSPQPVSRLVDLRTIMKEAPAPVEAPSASVVPKTASRSLPGEVWYGIRSELVGAAQIAKNVVGVAQKAAEKYSQLTGQDVTKSLADVQDAISELQDNISPDTGTAEAPGPEPSFGRKLLRGVGAAPVQLLEYGTAGKLLKNPILSFAVVDAAREADKGFAASAKAGALGAVEGWAFGKVGKIPALPKRVATGAGIGGTAAAVRGGGAEEITAGALMGGGFSTLGGKAEGKAAKGKPAGSPAEFKVIGPPEDLFPFLSLIRSPSQMFKIKPEAVEVVHDAIRAERQANHISADWEFRARRAAESLSDDEWNKVRDYLEDPKYTLNAPPTDSPKIQNSYQQLRTITEEVRQKVIEAKRSIGQEMPDTWGIEEGYYPHAQRGSWSIFYDGEPVPNGWLVNSLPKARAKAEEYLKINPTGDRSKLSIEFYRPKGAKGSGAESPNRFWGSGQKREADLPGYSLERSGLYDYLNGAARQVALAPLRPKLLEIKEHFESIDPKSELSRRWNYYMDRVEGRPDNVTRSANVVAQKFGLPSNTVERTTGFIRASQTLLKLGYSPVSAFTNSFQVPINLFPVLGAKYTWKGYAGFFSNFKTGKYNKLLEDLYIRDAVTKADEGAFLERARLYRPRSAKQLPRYALEEATALGMYMFRNVEYANRSISAIGAYERALAGGATKAAATRRAFQTEVRTQFAISQADAPVILSTPWLRTAFQFKSFWQKQLEFMVGLTRKDTAGRFDSRGKEMGRFVAAVVGTSGLVGLPGAEAFDAVLKWATGYSPLEKLKEGEQQDEGFQSVISKLAMRGAPSLAGVDMSRNTGFGDWFSASSWANPMGPSLQEATMAIQAMAANPGRERQDIVDKLKRRFSPEVRRISDAWTSPAAQRSETVDASGRTMVPDLTNKEKVFMTLGFTPERISQEREAYTQRVQSKAEYDSAMQGYVERVVELRKQGKQAEANQLLEEAKAKGYARVGRAAILRARQLKNPRLAEFERRNRRTLRAIDKQKQGRTVDLREVMKEAPPPR